jgi:UPF0755 protein
MAIRDGLRIEQVAALLQQMQEQDGLELDVRDFLDLTTDPPASLKDDYPFLKGLPAGNSLEGFLKGGTWEVRLDMTAEELVRELLQNWDDEYGDIVSQARKKGLDFYDVLRVASIVEHETPKDNERRKVAGVYWNRLDDRTAGETAGFLNADPTVIYGADTIALEDLPLGKWPEHVFWDALPQGPGATALPTRLASFQTYQNKGIPAWPISTPSRASLDAALDPDRKSRYLYFYACPGKDSHTFAKTLSQQNKNIAKCK